MTWVKKIIFNLFFFILYFSLLFLFCGFVNAQNPTISLGNGDVNNDGFVNNSDILIDLKYYGLPSSLTGSMQADQFKDNVINAFDFSVITYAISHPVNSPTPPPITCDFTIASNISTADGLGNFSAVKPGDTICFPAGTRSGIKLVNFNGTAVAPITFINHGGKTVINTGSSNGGIGITLSGSQHIHITGTGDSANVYGIEISNAANSGVDTNHAGTSSNTDTNGTEYVELDHLYIHDVGAGFRTAKNNNLLDTGIVWSGHQFYIHDNYINITDNEAMYIGTSDTHGSFPIYDIQVWNNKIDDAGYDGIQIRQAHTKVLVHHNVINGTGRHPCKNGTFDNTAGFNIAKGTDTGDWYDNTVTGARTAFYFEDARNVRVFNNLILDSGHATSDLTGSDCPANSTPPEGAVQVTAGSSNIQFIFNTIINKTIQANYGISIQSSTGQINNNIIGGTFASFITGSGMTVNNNLTNNSPSTFGFVNLANYDFHLTADSPAVNSASISNFPQFDADGIIRPDGVKSDIGAYEYHP